MYDRAEIENITMEYERALKSSGAGFTQDQIMALRTAFGMGIMQTLLLVDSMSHTARSSIQDIHRK